MQWHESAWKRLAFCGIIVLSAVAMISCRSDIETWQAKLAASNAPRLIGLWEVRLYDRGGDSLRPSPAVGQIALTLNGERVASPGFGRPPMVFGTYDIDFVPVGLTPATYIGFPGVVGATRGDTVQLKLASESTSPIELEGVMSGDSIVGRWSVRSRAGPAGAGDFVLRRR